MKNRQTERQENTKVLPRSREGKSALQFFLFFNFFFVSEWCHSKCCNVMSAAKAWKAQNLSAFSPQTITPFLSWEFTHRKWVNVCVCVSVWERERKREREIVQRAFCWIRECEIILKHYRLKWNIVLILNLKHCCLRFYFF